MFNNEENKNEIQNNKRPMKQRNKLFRQHFSANRNPLNMFDNQENNRKFKI